jgi:plasmid stabilization system protein ParE
MNFGRIRISDPRATTLRLTFVDLRVGQHVLYYRVFDTRITIVRILHVRMNPEDHLQGHR